MTDRHNAGAPDGVAEQTKQKAGEAQEKLQEGAQQARSTVAEQIDQRTGQASEQVRASSSALRGAADQLREQGQDMPAKAAARAADQGERLADYLRDTDGTRLLHDVEDFGRKRPAVVIGAGLLAGFALSRMLKASSEQRYRSTGPAADRAPYSQVSVGFEGSSTPTQTPPAPVPPGGTHVPESVPSPVGAGGSPGRGGPR